MILNFDHHLNTNSDAQTIVFIHGLFGSLSNLGMLARAFQETHHIVQIDVRNHGKSAHSNSMSYVDMAQDVLDTLNHLNIEKFTVVGHSMGGKISMKLAEIAKDRINKLIVLDMAPFAYQERHHDSVFKALFEVENANLTSRQEALTLMRTLLSEEMVVQFLMKSFNKGQFLFNTKALYENYAEIISWEDVYSEVNSLFIRGGKSPYVGNEQKQQAVQKQFPNSVIETVENAGHWLHAEKTAEVVLLMKEYLN
jgi:esterase